MRAVLIVIALVFPLVASSDTSEGTLDREIRKTPASDPKTGTDDSDFDACYEKAAWAFDEDDWCPAEVKREDVPCAEANDCKMCVAQHSTQNCEGQLYLCFKGKWKLRPGHINLGQDC